MFRPKPLDSGLIVIAAMLLFGANRLPKVTRSMGKAIRGFKDGLAGKENNDELTTR